MLEYLFGICIIMHDGPRTMDHRPLQAADNHGHLV